MKLVILDRDGVINEDSDEYIKAPDEWIPIPGSLEAIGRLSQAGYRVVVATNQSGIARGMFDVETLHRIHEKMHQNLAESGGTVDAIFFCPHGPDDGCECRKPKAGLLLDIAQRLNTSLNGVPAVGDSLRDLEAARAAGATPVFVRTGKGARCEAEVKQQKDVAMYNDLADFVDHLLEEKR